MRAHSRPALRVALLGLLAAPLTTACVTSQYTPRDTPWISSTLEAGMPRYVVRGRSYATLVDAAQADPDSQERLRDARSDVLWGTIIASLASTVTSLGATEVVLEGNGASMFDVRSPAIGFTIFGAGLASLIGGMALATGGQRDEIDAVNRFNDRMFEAWLREHDAGLAPATPHPD
ncbi:MAG: hypothetical protein U1F43_33235 [Myxococcota bacterium]